MDRPRIPDLLGRGVGGRSAVRAAQGTTGWSPSYAAIRTVTLEADRRNTPHGSRASNSQAWWLFPSLRASKPVGIGSWHTPWVDDIDSADVPGVPRDDP